MRAASQKSPWATCRAWPRGHMLGGAGGVARRLPEHAVGRCLRRATRQWLSAYPPNCASPYAEVAAQRAVVDGIGPLPPGGPG